MVLAVPEDKGGKVEVEVDPGEDPNCNPEDLYDEILGGEFFKGRE